MLISIEEWTNLDAPTLPGIVSNNTSGNVKEVCDHKNHTIIHYYMNDTDNTK